jgi:hypothetical protein
MKPETSAYDHEIGMIVDGLSVFEMDEDVKEEVKDYVYSSLNEFVLEIERVQEGHSREKEDYGRRIEELNETIRVRPFQFLCYLSP